MSDSARFILDRMESGRRYEPEDLRAFDPEVSSERLREIMHELWVSRQVERVGYSGWQRHSSAPPHRHRAVSREIQTVKPEDLFDHANFTEFFK